MDNIDYPQLAETIHKILKKKDPYEYYHQANVAQISVAIGKLMNRFNEHEMEMLKWGAALHDMGKIFLEDILLNFPRRLSVPERVKMELHTILGSDLAQDLGCDPIIIDIIHNHHCNLDGSGYPRNRAECSPFVCIVRVADTYDAMTNDRVYKSKSARDDAISVLKAEAGPIFDPLSVELLPFALIELEKE